MRGHAVRPADGGGAGAGAWTRHGWYPAVTRGRAPGGERAGRPEQSATVPRRRAVGGLGRARRAAPPARRSSRSGAHAVPDPARPAGAVGTPAPALAVGAACARVARHPLARPRRARVALAFGLLIAVGELARWGGGPGEREPAPLGAAGALAYALLGESGGQPTHHGVLQVVAVVVAAALPGCVPHVARGQRARRRPRSRAGVLTVGFAAVCFQPLYNSGELSERVGAARTTRCSCSRCSLLTALCDAVLAAAPGALRHPLARSGRCCATSCAPCSASARPSCATGAVMALAVAVAGLWALPVFCVPLLLTQLSFRRYAAVRTTYRQTIASLARATEIAGYTPPGHARRVAALSRAVGRELGLTEPELTVLEYAALMHDIGQLSLVDPVPAGPPPCSPPEQRRIALLGGAVVRQTGVDAEVAVVVERQADPYREQPLTARIVRAVNAYEEMAREAGPGGPLRRWSSCGSAPREDYQPEVVESLARVLARGGLTLPRLGNPWVMSALRRAWLDARGECAGHRPGMRRQASRTVNGASQAGRRES